MSINICGQLGTTFLIRSIYLGATLGVLLIATTPPLRRRLLYYGARASATTASTDGQGTIFNTLIDRVAALQVPHSWFTSFYVVSVGSSLVWASEAVSHGPAFRSIAKCTPRRGASMTIPQLHAVWALLLVQGSRRLYECVTFSRPSKSQMWIGHWLAGVLFYIVTGIAIWIEGVAALEDYDHSLLDLTFTAPSLRAFVATLMFILASGVQHDCHAYLASLKDDRQHVDASKEHDGYRLPVHPAFQSLVAPHYTAECVIYLSLVVLAAPQGYLINRTLLCALVFVVVNLGTTARLTKQWYSERFGEHAVSHRWILLPGVY